MRWFVAFLYSRLISCILGDEHACDTQCFNFYLKCEVFSLFEKREKRQGTWSLAFTTGMSVKVLRRRKATINFGNSSTHKYLGKICSCIIATWFHRMLFCITQCFKKGKRVKKMTRSSYISPWCECECSIILLYRRRISGELRANCCIEFTT